MPLPHVPHMQYRCHNSYHSYWLYGIMMVPVSVPCISRILKPDITATVVAHESLWTEIQYYINAEELSVQHRPIICHWSMNSVVQMCPEALSSVQYSTMLLYFSCVPVLYCTDKFIGKILSNVNCNKCCLLMIKESSKLIPALWYWSHTVMCSAVSLDSNM
jgi:hypothetical protein